MMAMRVAMVIASSDVVCVSVDDMPGDVPTLRKPFDQPALAAVLSALLSPKPAKEATPQCP
mgnify:CR=1 FL=1